jgi:hypothetical protein
MLIRACLKELLRMFLLAQILLWKPVSLLTCRYIFFFFRGGFAVVVATAAAAFSSKLFFH